MSVIPIENDSGLELLVQRLQRKPKGIFRITVFLLAASAAGLFFLRMDRFIGGQGMIRCGTHLRQAVDFDKRLLHSPPAELYLECFVTPRDAGELSVNMAVSIQVDAFDYHQWGEWHAVIETIADNYQLVENKAVISVICRLDTAEAKGKWPLRAGMTARVRFRTSPETLAEMIFTGPKLKNRPAQKFIPPVHSKTTSK